MLFRGLVGGGRHRGLGVTGVRFLFPVFHLTSVLVDVIPDVRETFHYACTESAAKYVHVRAVVPAKHIVAVSFGI